MPRYDFRAPRLFVEAPLAADAVVPLGRDQAHYLLHVLRLKPGDAVLAFNGRDGEWRALLLAAERRAHALRIVAPSRPQPEPGDLHLLFAPLKQTRFDYLVQKAVEMGASRLVPVQTQHGQVTRVNPDRMRAQAIEAAEQCGILTVPDIAPLQPLAVALAALEPGRLLVFCDEDAELHDPIAALRTAAPASGQRALAVCIGPEGGFAETERAALLGLPQVVRLALGPRILRADTAAVAALALVQAVLGDWR